MVSREILRAYRFFRRQGYGAASAIYLARAEHWARAEGIEFVWEDDPEGYPSDNGGRCYCGCGVTIKTCEACVCYGPENEGRRPILESLCGIWDASPEYRRVIEAELAAEATESEWAGAAQSVLSI